MQKAFARAYVLNGGKAKEAALEAGYGEGGAGNIALRNVRHKLVIAEIKRLSVVEVGAQLPMMIQKLLDMVDDPKTPPDVRARVIFGLMDRAGMSKAPTGPAVQVNVSMNGQGSQALIAEIWQSKAAREQALALPNGVDRGDMSGIDGSMSDNDGDLIDLLPDAPDAAAIFGQVERQGGDAAPGSRPGPDVIVTPSSSLPKKI